MRIVVATQNRGKLKELIALLAEPRLELLTLSDVGLGDLDVPETGATFEDNARLKAEAVARAAGLPTLADDTGLEVDALGGRPGVHSKRYAGPAASDGENNARLLDELKDVPEEARGARFRCVLALAVPDPAQGARTLGFVEGICTGRVAFEPRGSAGFGYDPLFVPTGWGQRTLADASAEEKNAVSHRGAAVRALRPKLFDWLGASL